MQEDTTQWDLLYESYVPEQQTLREALCTLGNGYFATRGAFAETHADEYHYPGTYLAGGYNRLVTKLGGREIENEDLVNMPNWLALTFRIAGGEWFYPSSVHYLSYRQILSLKEGLLRREVVFRDPAGRETKWTEMRLVHMRYNHLAALQVVITPLNWSESIEIVSALDGTVTNQGVKRYSELSSRHLKPIEESFFSQDIQHLKMETSQSELRLALAARTRLFSGSAACYLPASSERRPGYTAQTFSLQLEQGRPIRVEKVVSLYTSRDRGICECGVDSLNAIRRAPSIDELKKSHVRDWNSLWDQFDVRINLSQEAECNPLLTLRLHIFHLLQTISKNTADLDVGAPARGLHGEAYRGHIFWDELFIFPTLNYRMPRLTRAMLRYRYRRLDAARHAARELGLQGAMYPWQSGSNGREETQQLHLNPESGRWHPDNSSLQRHINLAIGYCIWQYYQVTGDIEYLRTQGAEMLIEIARFWASLAYYNQELDRYEIKGVMGPDEYHDAYPDATIPGIDNNAYTNVMTAWLLGRALQVLEILPKDSVEELCLQVGVQEKETEEWHDIRSKLRVCFHDGGIISQFEGYEKLEEFDWDSYRCKYSDIQRLDRILEAEGESPNQYKVSKQADVLMLFYLFSTQELKEIFQQMGYPLEFEDIRRNIHYYIKRTSHGSTLSRIVHSWVLAREDRSTSWAFFEEALKSDISDIQGGTTAEGIHLGAMAGTVDLMQRCYTGLKVHDDVLWFDPHLPDALDRISFRLHYRSHSLWVDMTCERLKIRALDSSVPAIQIGFGEEVCSLGAGETKEFIYVTSAR